MTIRILEGDCRLVMRTLDDASVDAIVTDPPYGLTNNGGGPSAANDTPQSRARAGAARGGFMGMAWDSDVPPVEVWAECLRVLKPGGYLLAFAGTRTHHRMCTRIEDAGFEIRDMIAWLYGSGFPKSYNGAWGGTALKPALEPITVARKPLIGTVEANWRLFGTGALNVDACRVWTDDQPKGGSSSRGATWTASGMHADGANSRSVTPPEGRWPANLIHDGSEEVLAAFPEAPGQKADACTDSSGRKTQQVYGAMKRGRSGEPSADSGNDGNVGFKLKPGARRIDAGTAARFFYCAKADRADRNAGLHDPGPQFKKGSTLRDAENVGRARKGNFHPTVKPTDLMRYLCRLVTPAGGVVLDPFMGSGSTLKAAELEGFSAIGIEWDGSYVELARSRIAADMPLFKEFA